MNSVDAILSIYFNITLSSTPRSFKSCLFQFFPPNLCTHFSFPPYIFFHRANWHSSVTLTEVSPCFFRSCKANARVQLAKTGHGPHSSQLGDNFYAVSSLILVWPLWVRISESFPTKVVVLFYVLFCVNVYCTAATCCQPNCS
jgi:hypothetical protein